jgi:hypothetical protein
MSRKQVVVPAIAFLATVSVVVPAGWQSLEADKDADGPQSRPARRVLNIDGAQITVDVDRRIVGEDGKVTVMLRGTAPTPREVELDLRFMMAGQSLSRSHRVPPPAQVERSTAHLTVLATPEGGQLASHVFETSRSATPGGGSYDLFELEVQPSVEDFKTQPNGAPNLVRVGVAGWTGNTMPVRISSPKVTREGTFEVDVTVKNNTADELQVWIDFGAPTFASTSNELTYEKDPDYTLVPISRLDDSPLAANAERVYRYTLTPARPELRSFLVLANVRGLDKRFAKFTREQLQRLAAMRPSIGALDTVTFERPATK